MTTISFVKAEPSTVKLCSADGEPKQAVKAFKVPPTNILGESLSTIVKTPVGSNMAAPTGSCKVMLMVSLDSVAPSSVIETVKVLVVSPAAKVKVPEVVV